MIVLALAALSLAVQQPPTTRDTIRKDTTRRIGAAAGVADSTDGGSASIGIGIRGVGKVVPLTDELRANAYRDADARALVARARVARTSQDSLLQSYEAHSVERMSMGVRLKAAGRDRLAVRGESATKIQWQRGVGAHMEVE